ncbi:MAG: discoidin domain-containing protein, partial [Dysgonamonadaceae bacterium]|nr:discoidin domain-containing protein [Dysgonamonadaceae bacterium]
VAEHFNNAGFEPIPLLGRYNNVINNNPMEFGLDLTDLTSIGFDLRNDYRYFLVLEIKSGSTGTGEVEELEVIRHEQGVGTVIGRMNAPMEISGGNKKIYIPIDVPGSSDITPTYLYVPQKRLSVASFSSQEASGEGSANGRAIYALDNNSSTFWHSRWSSSPQPLPHYIVFEIDSTYTLNGFEYLPRQNSANGRIGEYDVYILQSRNDNNGVLISSGTFDNDGSVKRAFFEPVQGKFVKIVNKKSAGGDPNTCMAEFNLFYSAETAGNTSLEEPEETTTMSVHQYRSTLFISGVTGNAVFELFNLQGQKVKSLSANVTGSSVTQLDIANLDSGIYILKSFTDKQTKSVKVFIK